jgi:hypothetical protein
MIVKQEDFQTAEGISGLNPTVLFQDWMKTPIVENVYEIMLFSQNGGLQQILPWARRYLRR